MPLFMLAYFLWNQSVRRYFAFFSRTVQTWRNIRRLLSVGLPISVQVVLEVMAFALSSIMMGWIGLRNWPHTRSYCRSARWLT